MTNNLVNEAMNGLSFGYQRVQLPSTAGVVISTPDSTVLSITGDIDIRARISLDDWTPSQAVSHLVSKWGANGASQLSYALTFNNTGTLAFYMSTTGTDFPSIGASTTPGFADGTLNWVRATRRQSDGRVQFFKASGSILNPVAADWTQIGTNQTLSAGTAIFDSTSALEIGSQNNGAFQSMLGNHYRAQIRNNILDDGTGIVFDADFTAKAFGTNSFTESSPNAATVTITGDIARAGDGRVLLNSSTPGTQALLARPFDDGLGHPVKVSGANTVLFNIDNVYLPALSSSWLFCDRHAAFSANNDWDVRVRVALDDWTPTGGCTLLSNNNANNAGIELMVNASGVPLFFFGTTQALCTAATGITDGAVKWVRATLDIDNGAAGRTARFYLSDDGVVWTQLGTTVTTAGVASSVDSVNFLSIGSRVGSSLSKGKFYRAQIRNNILDDGTGIILDFDASQRFTPPFLSDYLVIQDSKAGGSTLWYAGSHSINTSNNTGWIFSNIPTGNFLLFFKP